jgi:alanine racemase
VISAEQERRFGAAAHLLEAAGTAVPTRHLAASGGVLTEAGGTNEVVRVGLAQYGLIPDGLEVPAALREVAARLRPVMSLRAQPVRVAWLEAGSGVSYGPSFRTKRRSLIATLPVGYADGYFRTFSNRASALVRGIRVPQVGTVAMDAIMVDVTDVPGPEVTVDDEFTLLGEQGSECIGAVEMARWGDTISYEVLAGWSGRLPRVYYAAARTVGIRTLACEPEWSRRRLRPGA